MGNVLRVAKVSGDDIRLNMKLFKACVADWKKFCKDVEPGHMRVQVRGCASVALVACGAARMYVWGVLWEQQAARHMRLVVHVEKVHPDILVLFLLSPAG